VGEASHNRIDSAKEFFIQLATITAGVLIALLLEGAVAWNDRRSLVREARATIAEEIADNKKELDGTLSGLPGRREQLKNALRFADDLLKAKRTDLREMKLGFEGASLSTAGWQTAQTTGALSYMKYSDVQAYAEVYDLPALFTQQQRRGMERLTPAIALLSAIGDPDQLPEQDLRAFRSHVLELMAHTEVEEQLGRALSAGYDEVLRKP
jgi:hypothetical protein